MSKAELNQSHDGHPDEDALIHDASDAANRIFADYPEDSLKPVSEGGHLQGENNDVIFDPTKRVNTVEGRTFRRILAGNAVTNAAEKQELVDHANELHAQIDELHDTHKMQRKLDARLTERLRHESRIDLLTQARNRNAFSAEFPEMVEAALNRQQPLAILFADLDGFKRLNDNVSHAKGDEVLSLTGAKLQDQVRSGIDLIYRYGGDEFVVVLQNFKSPENIPPDKYIDIRAQVIQETIVSAYRGAGLPVDELGLGISIAGGVLTPGETWQEFVSRVDRDMITAKNERRALLKEQGIDFKDSRI